MNIKLELWRNMIKSIESFRKGELQYYDFVGELEGALDAGEFQSKELIAKWYDFWTPLEILRAEKGNNVTVEDANKFLSDMEYFLKSISGEDWYIPLAKVFRAGNVY